MSQYSKRILSLEQQLQAYIDAGMVISSVSEVREALSTIGYYRLRGYCYHLYDNRAKQFVPGTKFSDILCLYRFDSELSHLLLSFTAEIEVALRARVVEALLIHQDALVLSDPKRFRDKEYFWKNLGTLSGEIARSSDVFIRHHFDHHDGMIPVWAAVEVMSFGNLSKIIKNLKTGVGSSASRIVNCYKYPSQQGALVTPSLQMFSSWTQAVSNLRNICAHNSRIYNRTISTHIQIPNIDQGDSQPQRNGLYQIVLAMKYLRPSDDAWNQFNGKLTALFQRYQGIIDLNRINFPSDWATHFVV